MSDNLTACLSQSSRIAWFRSSGLPRCRHNSDLSWEFRLVATGGNDGFVKLWNTSDWTVSHALLNEGNVQIDGCSPVDAIAFSPDSSHVAAATVALQPDHTTA